MVFMNNPNLRKSVLFICVHNSARSQMAEGFFKHYYGEKFNIYSAGSDPGEIHPMSIRVMAEIGIDLSKHRSKSLNEFEGHEMDYVVTVCGGGQSECPIFTDGRNYILQSFEDPSSFKGTEEEKMEQFKSLRDDLKIWLDQFYTSILKDEI